MHPTWLWEILLQVLTFLIFVVPGLPHIESPNLHLYIFGAVFLNPVNLKYVALSVQDKRFISYNMKNTSWHS